MSELVNPFIDAEELLHRQVHPEFIQAGEVTSQAFRPFPRDDGKLSVDRNTLASAQEAYERHIQKIDPVKQTNLESAGTWSVSVAECLELELPPISDPIAEPEPNPAHCLIQFSDYSGSQRKKRAKKLCDKAIKRGATYRPG